MNQVFLSYASADRERARRLADAMTQRGYRVWWDRQIVPGQTFDEVIERELDQSACVVVLWSSASIKSQWVKTEAAEAAGRRILVPVRIDDVKIPLEFRRLQAADLTQWNGDGGSPEFEQFLRAVDHELLEHREALAEAPTLVGHVSAVASMPPSVPGAVVGRAASTAQSARPAVAGVTADAPVVSKTSPGGRWVWMGAFAAVVMLAGAAIAWVTYRNAEAPDLAGMSYEQAVAALSAAGLAPERREQPSGTETPGQVVAQSPPAGTLVARGTTVSLTVAVALPPAIETTPSITAEPPAAEPPPVAALATIPDLRGQNAERANALLTAAELTVGATTEAAANDVALGTILAQDPAPSQTIAKGSPVRITVATRRSTPELIGLSLQQAQEQLTRLGLTPHIERVRAGRREPDDAVLRQTPAAGSEIAAGGEVAITVATSVPKRVDAGQPQLWTEKSERTVRARCEKVCQGIGLRWTSNWNGTANTCTCDLVTAP